MNRVEVSRIRNRFVPAKRWLKERMGPPPKDASNMIIIFSVPLLRCFGDKFGYVNFVNLNYGAEYHVTCTTMILSLVTPKYLFSL